MSEHRELITHLGSSPIWSDGIKVALAGRSVVYFGTSLLWATALEASGAEVVAAVHVPIAGSPAEDVTFPLHVLEVDTRSRTALQIPLFTEVLDDRAAEVRSFLAEHDPTQQGVVICPLPVARAAIGDRVAWTTEAALARAME